MLIDDMINDLQLFPPEPTQLNKTNNKTVAFAVYELYGRRFSAIVNMDIEGCIIRTKHKRGQVNIAVMKMVTAAYIHAHRDFVGYVESNNFGASTRQPVVMSKLKRLQSAINGLQLNEDERQALIAFYQNLVATY